MDFIKKTELFFIQLQYCLTVEPEPILEGDKGNYSLMLKPDIFLKLINDFQIEYPFIPENKIIELKGLINKENINTKDALKIIENYKKQYWVLDTVIMFEPVTDKIKRTLKSIDSNISEKEINIELANYQKHLQAKREKIYIDLINEIQGLPNQQAVTSTVLEKEYDEIAKKYEKKYGHAIPFGAFLFDDLKKEVEKVEPVALRLVEYKKMLHFWVNTSLADSNIIGETEISKRLIPLIENEIYLLELNISNPHQETKKEVETDNHSNTSETIKYNNENFNQFIKDLEYNYPIYHAPISSYHQWQTNLKYLKQEILSNLIVLSNEAKKPYLKKLLFDLQEHYKYVHTVKSDVDELYDLYDTNEYKLLHERSYKNELHIILNNEPKKYEFPTAETFKINPFHIQEKFYNYHYGVTIRDAVDFIKFQEMEYGIREKVEVNPVNILDINKIGNTNIKHNSFKYTNNDSSRLKDLMNALIVNDLIDNETELKNFRKIFSGNEIDKQIIWIGNISELSYFIKTIHNELKKIEDTKQQIWKITSKCFTQSDGKPYDKSKFRGQKTPAKKSIIDKIVKIL